MEASTIPGQCILAKVDQGVPANPYGKEEMEFTQTKSESRRYSALYLFTRHLSLLNFEQSMQGRDTAV